MYWNTEKHSRDWKRNFWENSRTHFQHKRHISRENFTVLQHSSGWCSNSIFSLSPKPPLFAGQVGAELEIGREKWVIQQFFFGHEINNVNTNLIIKLMGLHWGRLHCVLTHCLYLDVNQNEFSGSRNAFGSIDFPPVTACCYFGCSPHLSSVNIHSTLDPISLISI